MSDADTEMARVWKEIREFGPYKKHSLALQPACPNCMTKQVQLISHSKADATFKCRHCNHKFDERF